MRSKLFSRSPFSRKSHHLGTTNRRFPHHRRSQRNFQQHHNHTMKHHSRLRSASKSASKNVFNFYSNPEVKNMKWIDLVKHVHKKNIEHDRNTLLSKSLKDASKIWKKR
jgi:hypothetical protein